MCVKLPGSAESVAVGRTIVKALALFDVETTV
jgi:hypothetical protein